MIIATAFLAFFMLVRWQIVHLHTSYSRPYIGVFHVGQTVYHLGVKSTVVDVKTVDMVIRRHLIGLFFPRHRWHERISKEV